MNMHYHLTPYVPSLGKFHVGKGQDALFSESNANEIKEYYQQKLTMSNKLTAQELERELNNALLAQSQQYDNLVMSLIEELNNANLNALIDKGFMKAGAAGITLDKTRITSKQYENEFRQIVQNIFPGKETIQSEDIRTVIRRLNSHLTPLRKSIFNNLVADMLENMGNEVSQLSEEAIDSFVQQLQANLKGGSVNIPNASSSMTLSLRDNEITITSPKGNANVVISGLSGDIDSIGIKTRSYSNLSSQVSLISGANVSGLISTWPTNSSIKNLALNGLSGRDPFGSQFSIMKDIFLLQATADAAENDILNSFIIIGTSSKERPIAVFSVAELYFGEDELDADFSEIAPIGNVPRSQADFAAFVVNTRISIRTKMSLGRMLNSY